MVCSGASDMDANILPVGRRTFAELWGPSGISCLAFSPFQHVVVPLAITTSSCGTRSATLLVGGGRRRRQSATLSSQVRSRCVEGECA